MKQATLRDFDDQIRRGISAEPGFRIERTDRIVRVIGAWNCILHAQLDDGSAARTIEAEVELARQRGEPLQWKAYGHDEPHTLPQHLEAAGFSLMESETLMLLELEQHQLDLPFPSGIVVRRLPGAAKLQDVAAVSKAAFGQTYAELIAEFEARLPLGTLAFYLAYDGSAPVGAGRLELPQGTDFAGLYGGGIAPAYRRRGIYRSLVAARAREARDRGYRYLNVEANASSRAILDKLGFTAVSTVSTWHWRPADAAGDAA